MQNAISGLKIAVLVANGFNELQMTALQRAFQKRGAHVRIVGMDSGLINGWTGDAWGHHYAADHTLNTALAADYDLLVVPGGTRSVEKLKLTAHTKRFVGGFVKTDKPCAILDEAIELLAAGDLAVGRVIEGAPVNIDGNIITTQLGDDVDAMVQSVCDHFEGGSAAKMAA